MHVIFKLRRWTDDAVRRETIEFAETHGAADVQPLLPEDADPDARLMLVARVATEPVARKLVARLNRRPEVEYAELGPRRRPRKPH